MGDFLAVTGGKIGNDFAIGGQLPGNCMELVGGDFFDALLGGRTDGGIEMNLVRANFFYRRGDFGKLGAIRVETVNTEYLEPDLAWVFIFQGAQAINQAVEGNLLEGAVYRIEGLLVAGIE